MTPPPTIRLTAWMTAAAVLATSGGAAIAADEPRGELPSDPAVVEALMPAEMCGGDVFTYVTNLAEDLEEELAEGAPDPAAVAAFREHVEASFERLGLDLADVHTVHASVSFPVHCSIQVELIPGADRDLIREEWFAFFEFLGVSSDEVGEELTVLGHPGFEPYAGNLWIFVDGGRIELSAWPDEHLPELVDLLEGLLAQLP